MPDYQYLIVGGGMAADAAVQGIREVDPEGSIGLFSAESHPPYNRPPLSKGLWKNKSLESIWRGTESRGVALHLDCRVQALDLPNKRVRDLTGTVYGYDKLLLATGGTPRRLPFGDDQVIYYRTVDDYYRLRELADEGRRLAVIGGGFVGSEVAAGLAMNGTEVVMAFPEQSIGSRLFPPDLGRFVTDAFRLHGVDVRPGQPVVGLHRRNGDVVLTTQAGQEIVAGGVVAGIGIQPNVELARTAGLLVENGIVVDEFLRTAHPDVYAAGDVAAFYNPALGTRLRVEHEDNANTMGQAAGRSMAGEPTPYHHLPFFYSDLFELGYEAVGELDARLETVVDWQQPYRKGVVYYLREGRVRGVLLWNVWDQVENARQLIAEPGPFRAADLQGRLPA
jgi:NADPH-dependent 2,4-dienoyl-CoA reductase/sulfur reductase-like enzyme